MPSPPRRRVLQGVAAIGGSLLAGCLSDAPDTDDPAQSPSVTPSRKRTHVGPWPTFGADAGNSGYAPNATGPTGSVDVGWRFDGGTPTLNASPILVDDTVYTGASGDPGGIFAIHAATGEQQWGIEPDGYVTSAPAIVDGTLYVGTWAGTFYALDTSDGSEVWSTSFEHRFGEASPTVVDDTVYVATYGYAPLVVSGEDDEETFEAPAVIALSASSGEERWRYDDFGERDSLHSSPAADADHVYIGGDDDTLYALTRHDGSVAWRRDVAGHSDPDPAVVDGTVYYASLHDGDDTPGRLWALEAASGETRWTYDVGDISLRTSPAVTEDTVYLAGSTTTGCPAVGGRDSECTSSASGTLYAIDRATGEERWTAPIEPDTRSSPAVAGGVVYVGCGNGISAVSTDGETAWRVDFRESSERDDPYVDSSPAVGDGRAFVGCSDGHLYAIEEP